jgi:hypothetical protein
MAVWVHKPPEKGEENRGVSGSMLRDDPLGSSPTNYPYT